MNRNTIRVLHVEDNPRERQLFIGLSDILEWQVVSKSDGMQGLVESAVNKYDLIVTDVSMPKLSGLEMAALIRGSENPNQMTPILLVSCCLSCEVIKEARRIGIEATESKPLMLSALKEHGECLTGVFNEPTRIAVGATRL